MKKKQITFPKRFLWGAATAAHQVEGGNTNQWTVWENEHAKSLAAQAEYQYGDLENWQAIKDEAKDQQNYISGAASDHYTRYEEDFELVSKLQLNAFRFSVEWSRIEPAEGAWNVEAIEHYKQYVAALKARDIEPMLTLFHFTIPTWFAEKGGFEKRANVKLFMRFAEKILTELGGSICYVITINEPEVYASQSYREGNWPPQLTNKRKAFSVLNNLAYAHNKTANMIHGLHKRYKVSIAKNSPYNYPGDDALMTRAFAASTQYMSDDYFLNKVKKQCDFIGVNYYFSNRVYGYRFHNPDERLSDLGWDMQPENLEYVLERLYRKYKLPLIVTENGLADADDSDRKWWLAKTMLALQNALAEGVDVRGYFHWSLLDNVEWDKGKWPRFGLVAVNYKTQQRTVRPSAIWWAKLLHSIQKGGHE